MAARLASILVVVIVGATLIAGLIVGAQREDNSLPVDVIIHNAKVYEADDAGTIADAVAIRGNKIVHVGLEREIMRYRRKQTTVIDAKGAAVLPGFDDAHVSLIEGGLAHDAVQLFGENSLDDVRARIAAWLDTHADAAWITGGGWSYDAFPDMPTRAALDAIASDKPAALLSQDGDALWVNTKALDAAGITKRTPNPKRGEIVRDRRRRRRACCAATRWRSWTR
jgi:predicted amidohydrolase YtcJ